jgi:hypothetical protein
MYHVINIQTHYNREIARKKIKNHRILPISRQFLTEIRLPRVGPHLPSPATELSAHSAKLRPYSTEFGATDGDFFRWRPTYVACSSGGGAHSHDFYSADTGGGNSLHVRCGLSGPILSYLIYFEF